MAKSGNRSRPRVGAKKTSCKYLWKLSTGLGNKTKFGYILPTHFMKYK